MSHFYPDVFAVEIIVDRGIFDIEGVPMDVTRVQSRPDGSDAPFDLIFEDFSAVSPNPFPNGLIGSWGVANLDDGGTMFIDDVLTVDLRDPAGVSVANLINEAFDQEFDAFVKVDQDANLARQLIESAIDKITLAEQAIGLGGFQASTRVADALTELANAKDRDRRALDSLDSGDTSRAKDFLIFARTFKARAELFMRGHNPQPGPFPDGLGGFDVGDPVFADGFESGDVSAWSTSQP